MKRKFFYPALGLLFLASTAFVVLHSARKRNHTQSLQLKLLPRNPALAYANEWPVVQQNVSSLLNKIKQRERDIRSLNALAAIFLQEARITGNFSHYNKAVIECVSRVLQMEPMNFEALSYKTTVHLSKHEFEEALKIASQLNQKYPHNASIYGMLVDAHVELGNYGEAVAAAGKMISIRPDIRSYSRIAYLREIHGDLQGAIDAIQLAIDAGAPGDETTEWCRTQLAKLYEQCGKIREAEMQYAIALTNRENFPPALTGMARIETGRKNYSKALSYYQQADSISSDHTIKEGMKEIYSLTGKRAKEEEIAQEILVHMKRIAQDGNEDLELAHANMGTGDQAKALEHAMIEYNRRPGNIEVNETLALVYYESGEYQKADSFIEAALKTNCKKPELLCNAGMIFSKMGDTLKAKTFLQEALQNDPLIPLSTKKECSDILNSLK